MKKSKFIINRNFENPPRRFQGVYIPEEIWLSKDLSLKEKILWAELQVLDHALERRLHLCKFLEVSEDELDKMLEKFCS